MCIAIVTTSHKDYRLILLNNRDEYLQRPTAPAEWWVSPHGYVLGGRDLHRAEQGTWLGITKQGRLACLTNFREDELSFIEGRRSRGAVMNAFLKTAPDSTRSTKDLAHSLIEEGLDGIGGFSLLFGKLDRNFPSKENSLAIVSNRSTNPDDIKWILQTQGETHALSNSHYGDNTWPKVVNAEKMVGSEVLKSMKEKGSEGQLIERLLGVLSQDTLPKRKVGERWETYTYQMRDSIFVPPVGDRKLEEKESSDEVAAANGTPIQSTVVDPTGGVYGTQKQTAILVDNNGRVTYFERTLHDGFGNPIPIGAGDRKFGFEIEGW